jgi:hypothetical protein
MITPADVNKLATVQGPCLSIFEPLRDEFSQVTKPDTRLNDALQKAEKLLIENGFNEAARAKFLRPIQRIVRAVDWQGRTGSLVVFRAPGFMKAGFWPEALQPRVTLADEFMILPLLAGLGRARNFWVLGLSINRVRLFRGTRQGLTEVELPKELPRSLAEAGGFDQPDHDLEARSAPGASSGQTAAVRFGTSSIRENRGRHLHDFFRLIDRAIQPVLRQNGDPLVLAAVERELALYREVNSYAPVLEQAIHGSPEALGTQRLHRTALELVVAASAATAGRFGQEIYAAAGKGLLITDPTTILQAARMGQIERLFVRANSRSHEKLVNSAALAVFGNSGTVAACSELPGTVEELAAVLRYRAVPESEPELAASRMPA